MRLVVKKAFHEPDPLPALHQALQALITDGFGVDELTRQLRALRMELQETQDEALEELCPGWRSISRLCSRGRSERARPFVRRVPRLSRGLLKPRTLLRIWRGGTQAASCDSAWLMHWCMTGEPYSPGAARVETERGVF